MPELISFWGYESNPNANPSTAYDGGGYPQPHGGAAFRAEDGSVIVVHYQDESCGYYSSRRYAQIETNGKVVSYAWGDMFPKNQQCPPYGYDLQLCLLTEEAVNMAVYYHLGVEK